MREALSRLTSGGLVVAEPQRGFRVAPEREAGNPQRMNEGWSAAHAAYHEALVAACDSPWLLRLRGILYAQSERYRRLSVPLAGVARDLDREHREIMEAALARDARRAGVLMTEHIELTTRVLLERSWPDDVTPRAVGRGARATDEVATAA